MNKQHLLTVAAEKHDDARLLFDNGRFSNSFYLFGYVVELLLKARISSYFQAGVIPDKKLVNDIYVHDLGKLVLLAGLATDLDSARAYSTQFDQYWLTIREWSEAKRYDMIAEPQSSAMYRAMTDKQGSFHAWLLPFCC